MKKSTPGYPRILVLLLVLFVAELALLFLQYKEASTVYLQLMMGLIGLTVILIGYFLARFRGRDWKGDRDYQ